MTIRNFFTNRARPDIRESVTPDEFEFLVQQWTRDITDPADDESELREAREIATAWVEMDYVLSERLVAGISV